MDMNFIKDQFTIWMKNLALVDPVDLSGESEMIRSRDLRMQGIANARQLGGYIMRDGRKIKMDRLLRTANLYQATEEDCRRLAQEYELKLVLDLRSHGEHLVLPDKKVDGSKEIWIGLMEDAPDQSMGALTRTPRFVQSMMENPSAEMITVYLSQEEGFQDALNNLYLGMLTNETSKKGFRQIFQEILQLEGGTVLWHCAQGKDRCGLTAALLLGTLGAGYHLILEDFALSNVYYKDILRHNLTIAQDHGASPETMIAVQGITGVNPGAMKKAMDFTKNNYGSVSNYVRQELGITGKEIEQLRDWYLE